MPSSPKAPKYTPHGYTYWANFFASPTDYLINKAQGGGNTAAPSKPASVDLVAARRNADKLANDVDLLNLAGRGNAQALQQVKGLKATDLSPEVQSLYKSVKTLEAQSGTEQDPGFLSRVFDILSRPMYAIANANKARIDAEQMRNKSTDINDISYAPIIGSEWWAAFTEGEALWRGFSGQDKTDWMQILNQVHPDMPDIAKGVLGFALDVGMDPTSYIGVGIGKSIGKGLLGEGAKLVNDAEKIATDYTKAISTVENGSEKIKNALTQAMTDAGIVRTPVVDGIDFASKSDVTRFLVGNLDTKSGLKSVSTSSRNAKVNQQRVVSAFIAATHDVIKNNFMEQYLKELATKAVQDGALVPLEKVHPTPGMVSLTPRALSMPEADLVAEVKRLYSERAALESAISRNKKNRGIQAEYRKIRNPESKYPTSLMPQPSSSISSLVARKAEVQKQLDELLTQTPIDLHNPEILKAIDTVATKNPEFVAANTRLAEVRKELRYWTLADGRKIPAPEGIDTIDNLNAFLRGDAVHGDHLVNHFDVPRKRPRLAEARGIGQSGNTKQGMNLPEELKYLGQNKPGAARYRKLIEERDALEATKARVMASEIVKATSDLHITDGQRMARYRNYKNWKTLASKYAAHYNDAMKVQKMTDATATAAADAGDLGVAVGAKLGLEKTANTSKLTDKSLKALTAEIQHRLNIGQMTKEDLVAFLKEAGIKDPSLIHDFSVMTPEASKLMHTGQALPDEIVKIANADPQAVKDITLNNQKTMHQLMIEADAHATKVADEIFATAIDLMADYMSLEARKSLDLRLGFMGGGPVVASLATPALVEHLVELAYKTPVVKQSIQAFNKTLVSSAGLDKGINRIRAREAGRTTEVIARNGARIADKLLKFSPKDRSIAWEQLLRTDTKVYTNPELVQHLHDELTLIAEKFAPDAFPGLRDPLTIAEVNEWIPGRYKMKERKLTGWKLDARVDKLAEGDDPATWLVNTINASGIKDMDPAQLIWDLQIASEKALARKATVENIVQMFGIPTGKAGGKSDVFDPLAQQLVDKHGYHTHRLGKDEFIFDPETLRQLDKIQELFASPKMMETFGEYAGKVTQAWKRAVTVYNPGFHVRNTFGDIFVSWLDGVQGIHGVQSHQMALRTINRFRHLTDPNDPMIKAMGQPEMGRSYEGFKAGGKMPESHNTVLFTKNGKDVTIGDIYAYYVNEGLLSGYTNTEFSAVFKSKGTLGATPVGQNLSKLNQGVLHLSESREDVMRMAHFIDVIRKSPIKDFEAAAAEAGARVRKFHFDYSDFTMTEKLLFARMFPFYKWTRKALPLMVESLFAKPGKMMLYPKAQQGLATAAGYDSMGPDVVVPEWIQSRILAPVRTADGVTSYLGVSLPYDALRSAGAPGDTLLGMLHPVPKAAIGWAQGKVPGTDKPFSWSDQLLGSFPQSNFASKQVSGRGTPEQAISFLTGLTVTQNNSKTIQAQLMDRKEAAINAKKSQQQSAPK